MALGLLYLQTDQPVLARKFLYPEMDYLEAKCSTRPSLLFSQVLPDPMLPAAAGELPSHGLKPLALFMRAEAPRRLKQVLLVLQPQLSVASCLLALTAGNADPQQASSGRLDEKKKNKANKKKKMMKMKMKMTEDDD